MSLNFAVKDLYRKKKQHFPYLLAVLLITLIDTFIINFTSSFNVENYSLELNQNQPVNKYFLTGSIYLIYSQFNTLDLILTHILTIIIILSVTTSLVIAKKQDLWVMRALGTLPSTIFSFFLGEVYLLFLFGYVIGLILGIFLSYFFFLLFPFFGFFLIPTINSLQILGIFLICLFAIYLYTGRVIRKLGNGPLIKSFGSNISATINSAKPLDSIPRWLSSIGLSFKISLINTLRKKKEYRRYLISLTLILLILFTLSLGSLVLNESTRKWINKAQGDNVIIIGHKDVIYHYSLMYAMFSDPQLVITDQNIDFSKNDYFFSRNNIKAIEDVKGILSIEDRIITFCQVKERAGLLVDEYGEYERIGQNREGIFPIIGIQLDSIITNSEIEGKFFSEENYYNSMVIGDGLAYNFFDYPLNQSINVVPLKKDFHITGVIIDSFYNGYAGYIGLTAYQDYLNLDKGEVNLILLSIDASMQDVIESSLSRIITKNLGKDFGLVSLEPVFNQNYEFLNSLTLYPLFLICLISLAAILTLYNYQNATFFEKVRDLLIMKKIGAKSKLLNKILFLENFYIILPAAITSLALTMILIPLLIFERSYLPSLGIPLLIFIILFSTLNIINVLSIKPLMKKLNDFSIKQLDYY